MRLKGSFKNLLLKKGERRISICPVDDEDVKIFEKNITREALSRSERKAEEEKYDNKKPPWKPLRKPSKRCNRLMFIIDTTFSVSLIFPLLYCIIESLVKEISWEIQTHQNMEIKYGLTLMNQRTVPVIFENGAHFTESEEEFLQTVRSIEFKGGSDDGRENLKDVLDTALCVLNQEGDRETGRGLLMFSDSLSKEGEEYPDFYEEEQKNYINKGLQFAGIYTYSESFNPMLRIVDKKGVPTENGENECFSYSIRELLEEGDEKTVERIMKQIRKMF